MQPAAFVCCSNFRTIRRGNVAPETSTYEFPTRSGDAAVRRVVYGLVAIRTVAIYGTAGYLVMGWSLLDALFQVVITISGVGFNEVRPLDGDVRAFHTMIVIGMGMLSVAFTLGSFVQFLTESEILDYFGRHRMMKQIETLSGHTIVAGYGRVGGLVCDELAARNSRSWSSSSIADQVAESSKPAASSASPAMRPRRRS